MAEEHKELIDGWMELDTFCLKYGQRKNTIHKRVHDGVWPTGEYFSSPDGKACYVHEDRACRWLQEQGKLKL